MANERMVTVEEVRTAVESIGWNYIEDRALSTHRADWYLRVVSGFRIREIDNSTEYACWLLNADRSEPVLAEGYYTLDAEAMREKYINKR